jgi:NAD(P)-dependent dehydrogenase (short-subunit alcohol dehydrogenase family)
MPVSALQRGSIEGRSLVVTGGGTGIGAACAERLVADGARVTICGRTESKLADVAARLAPLAASTGGAILPVVADVTDEASVLRLIEAAVDDDGVLHGLVANAGGGGAITPLHLQETEEFLRVLHLNVLGTMLLVKHSVPPMVAGGGGSFVGMSSIAGHVTHPYFGAYTVAKAGIEELMRNAADEYGEVNLRFNAVRPSFTATEIMNLIPRDSAVYASYVDNTPLAAEDQGALGEGSDVADLVRFLLGDEARWITGQIINVDGGHHLRRGPDFGSFIEPVLGRDKMLGRQP